MNYRHFTLIVLFITASLNIAAQVNLSPLFTNNMVLQQQTNAPIWGEAKPGKKVTITTSWDNKTHVTKADEQGKWQTTVATPKAGGPYEILIASGKKKHHVKLKNVSIGEVWICSGQSNMEWRVRNDIKNMKYEISKANYPDVRMITVKHKTSVKPLENFEAERDGWEVCSPETVGEFSAVGYFFGRDLHLAQGVPVGLINSSWGGTLAEVWADAESLMEMPYFHDFVKNMLNPPEDENHQEAQYQESMEKWVRNIQKIDPGYSNNRAVWASLDFNDDSWFDFPVPGIVQRTGLANHNGVFWFRKIIELPADWAGKDLLLKLGRVDDDDISFFNEAVIGHTEGWLSNREYKIPGNLVKAGKNIITVRVTDSGGDGGFSSESKDIVLENESGQKIPLSGIWKAKYALSMSEIPLMPSRAKGNLTEPTVLFNAMINPLIPYAIKGAVWYQGEANAGRAYQYRELLPIMINGWRKYFGKEFQFYIVQLANFGKPETEPTESTWAELRESQFLTAKHLEHTGIVTAIDIGEAYDIHLRNKQEVGRRLTLAARAQTYGENVPFSGPVYKSHKIVGNTIRIKFDHNHRGLITPAGEKLKGFTIAGPDRKFYKADARFEWDEIVVSAPEVEFPVAVRYAWADNPVCNLYNGLSLPALPFRTDDWKGITE